MLPFVLFMLGCGSIITLMIWLDYRRLGPQAIDAQKAELLAASALARWKIGAEIMPLAQRTERAGRLSRLFSVIRRNARLALYCDAGIAAFFFIIFLISVFKGNAIDGKYILGWITVTSYFCGLFTALIFATTFILAFDIIGVRTLKTFFGRFDTTACEVSFSRDGILSVPGRYQRFNYPVINAEIMAGEVSVIRVVTAFGKRQQDFYIPVPKGLEADAGIAMQKLTRGY